MRPLRSGSGTGCQADRDAGRRQDGLTTVEREELRRVRRENRTLREERETPTAPVQAGEAVAVLPRATALD